MDGWTSRDQQFIRKVIIHDFSQRRNEIFAVRNAQGVKEVLVVEFDYDKVPVKVTFGSPASCPLPPNEDARIRADWVGLVERARSMKDPFIIRSYIPAGDHTSCLLEVGSFDDNVSW